MNVYLRSVLLALSGILITFNVSMAQTDAATLAELRQIIAQQQQQLEVQARTLDTLQQQVQALSDNTDTASGEQAPVIKEQAKVTRSGQEKVKLTVSGQVNRGLLLIDDGEKTETFNVDNDNSSTRVRFTGAAKVTDDVSLGTQIEVQFESNSTAAVNQDSRRNVGPNSFTERKLELFVDSQRLGRLSLGQGDTASNGTSESDLSGTGVVAYSGVADFAGGILFRDKNANALSSTRIGSAFSNLDGLSRDDRLRYDSPKFNGLRFSTSYIADDRWDAALRYSGDFGGLKAAAAIAYADPNGAVDNRVNGSASLRHGSGVSVTVAAGRDDRADRDPEFWYIKLGYLAKLSRWGDTAFAIDYYDGDDIAAKSDESKTYGFFVVQNLKMYGTELYVGLRNYELDRKGADFDDITAVLAGARVKF